MIASTRFAPPATFPSGLSLRFCRLDDDTSIALDDAAASLDDEEIKRAGTFRFRRDHNRFVRARGFLRREISAVLGLAADKLDLRIGPQGKPFLAHSSALGFNLSHSAGLAVLALREEGPVGIDLEALQHGRGCAGLADSCLTPMEVCSLAALPAAARETAFLACWTAKEAAVKLTGTGWSRTPQSVRLNLKAGKPATVLDPPARLLAVSLRAHVCHIALPVEINDSP